MAVIVPSVRDQRFLNNSAIYATGGSNRNPDGIPV